MNTYHLRKISLLNISHAIAHSSQKPNRKKTTDTPVGMWNNFEKHKCTSFFSYTELHFVILFNGQIIIVVNVRCIHNKKILTSTWTVSFLTSVAKISLKYADFARRIIWHSFLMIFYNLCIIHGLTSLSDRFYSQFSIMREKYVYYKHAHFYKTKLCNFNAFNISNWITFRATGL